jgi:hypothetical protein
MRLKARPLITSAVGPSGRDADHPESVAQPPNLHVALTSAASSAPALSERVEQKFFILPHRESLAFALLRRNCRQDPEYPVGQVNSLYFDTPDLDQHQRSDSGESTKDKVRIRWYGSEYDPHRTGSVAASADASALACAAEAAGAATAVCAAGAVGGGAHDVQVWLELKSRRGLASTKQRVALSVPVGALRFGALQDGIVPAATLMTTMAGFGFFGSPVIAVSYWRYRFVEPRTGFRVSIDSHIRSSVVMPGIGEGERGLELPGAVVEVKGPVFDVPCALREIAEIGSSWTRYSKYSSSLDGHTAVRGSASRLWPSGTMNDGPGVLASIRQTAG